MLYKYSGFDSSGLKVKSQIEALTLSEAKTKLKAKGILYTSIKEDTFNFGNISFKRSKKLDLSTLSYLSRDLSIYLNSGITLISSINLLKQRYKNNKALFTFFDTIKTHLDEGKTFYDALDSQKAIRLPDFYKQSIKVSESGGLLESVLLELSVFLKQQDRIKKQVTSALAYPMFILLVSFLMVGFMLSFIVPKITVIFTQLDQELPPATNFVIALGDFFSNNYGYIILAFVSVISIFLFLLKKSKTFKYGFDKFLLKVPFFFQSDEMLPQ
jgi:general secretion pathway protein F/type IV pilus assembly protein PilC